MTERELLAELRRELDKVDEVHWTQRIFELVEEIDRILKGAIR
jgi:hypothetical protein